MAGVFTWLLSSITGGNSSQETSSKITNQQSKSTGKSKLTIKPTTKKNKAKHEDPSFDSSLQTPIEEVIEDSIVEDIPTEEFYALLQKNTNKNLRSQSSQVDSVGFSFFSASPKEKPEKNPNRLRPKPKSVSSEPATPIDDLGFSFIPLSDRKQLRKARRERPVEKPSTIDSHTQPPIETIERENTSVEEFGGLSQAAHSKSSLKTLHSQASQIDSIGFSFFNLQPKSKPDSLANKEISKSKSISSEPATPIDGIGFSFLPLSDGKQLRKIVKGKPEIANESQKKKNISVQTRSSLKQEHKVTSNVSEPIVQKKIIPELYANTGLGNVINRTQSSPDIEETHASKKVHRSTSYASVVANNFDKESLQDSDETNNPSLVDFQFSRSNEDDSCVSDISRLHYILAEETNSGNFHSKKSFENPSKGQYNELTDQRSEIKATNSELTEKITGSLQPVIEVTCSSTRIHSKTDRPGIVQSNELLTEVDVKNKTIASNFNSVQAFLEHERLKQLSKEKTIVEKLSESNYRSENNVTDNPEDDFEFVEKIEFDKPIEINENIGKHEQTKENFTSFLSYGFSSKQTDEVEESTNYEKSMIVVTKSENIILSNETLSKSLEGNLTEKKILKKGNKNCSSSNSVDTLSSSEGELKIELHQKPVKTENPRKMKTEPGAQIRVLQLHDKCNQESTIYRIENDWILEFRLGPSLLGRKVQLYCNYPREENQKLNNFARDVYQVLPWSRDEGCENSDDTALSAFLQVKLAGSFHFYYTEDKEILGSGYFLVDPILTYGDNEKLPLDCIQCQTVISKNLGSFSTWESKLRVTKESGYNMIHYTPIQELGASNSAYSLSDQLKLNPIFRKLNSEETSFADIEEIIARIRKEWKVVSICDIVLNHTANESEWLKKYPEVTYNCNNCPYLRPAYMVDAALHQFSLDIQKGLYENLGIPSEINHEDHLNAIRYQLHSNVLHKLKISEFFTCDTSKLVAEFHSLARKESAQKSSLVECEEKLQLIQDPQYRRLTATVDMKLALKLYNLYRNDSYDEETRLKRCAEDFKNRLDSLNNKIVEEINEDLQRAVKNCISGIHYHRVQHDGPRIKEISEKNPLVHRYFTDYGNPKSIKEHEEIMYSENGKFLMAHNGWVMDADPLSNFAAAGTKTYIRRELIAWGDSVKLRYGSKPDDCPYLWNHMRKYVEQTAKIFDGVRLDNCHSTPIHVAEYLLDCARKVNPDLYVAAELFTNSDHTDNIFVNKLGITSLIREAMSAWDSHEQGRLVYRYGGYPVGSFYQPNVRPLVSSIAHALFLDLTHDNPSPVEKRSVFDLLPSAALVNMACCASGSNRGYDELVPHHIHVVNEKREYTEWTDDEELADKNKRYVSRNCGIIAAKKALNDLHFQLGKQCFNQVYVDQMDGDIVAVTRHSPESHISYILVAFTAFTHPHENCETIQRNIKPLRVEGFLEEIVLEATLSHQNVKTGGSKYDKSKKYKRDDNYINGYSEYEVTLKQNIPITDSTVFEKVDSGTHNIIQLNFKNFKPGSIAVIKVSLPEDMRESVNNVRNLVKDFSISKETELSKIIKQMTLADLNRAIYRCDQEERDEGNDLDVYDIPGYGPLVYAGLQGFISLLSNIRPSNDLGHPMCRNLRDGNWMIDYIWQRLKFDEGTKELGQWIEKNTESLKTIPRYLIPCYLDIILTGIYVLLLEQCFNSMSEFVKKGSAFVKALSLGSVQFGGYIKSAELPTLSHNLREPKPTSRKTEKGERIQTCVSLSAGLPHFSVGYMRNWGRDTFIALRGLFLLTGRYQEARYHILAYGGCLRHGLIPNLLDGGKNSRYNCRDAVWWWLHCIKSYVQEAPQGINILKDIVSRIFPTDDSPALPVGASEQPLEAVIQEALNIHFQGLAFRERNAGKKIDEHMREKGFNNQIGIHPETGFVFGGNDENCGTWMDKMGSSDKAGNRGKPATPRDGTAVELVGLQKSVITWLDNLHKQGTYPFSGVERKQKNGNVIKWSFKEWSDKIQNNFEKCFWINTKPAENESKPSLINKRGIYKDCFGASREWTDYQLRCNFPIAMTAAPELFDPQHAWIALNMAEKHLLGVLGMKTLDPDDWAYHGDYDNSDDSTDPKVAHGYNYHQGPEWVWPIAYFLRAKLIFAEKNRELTTTIKLVKLILSKHYSELQTSPWCGLPELTNSNGSFCKDSSRTQAWSMGCILEVLHDLQKIEGAPQKS